MVKPERLGLCGAEHRAAEFEASGRWVVVRSRQIAAARVAISNILKVVIR